MVVKSKQLHKKRNKKEELESTKKIIEKSEDKELLIQERGFAIFAIGPEWYCIDMNSIFEIMHSYEIKPVSHLPDFFEGVTNLRGESIPVVNLRQLLGLTPGKQDSQVCIISESNGTKTGFLIDSDVEIISSSDVQFFSLPDCYDTDEQKFLEGIIEHKNRLIGVLKLTQALQVLSERRSNNEEK